MLEIINDLKPFFEDCYKEFGVREYSRLTKITPPTASKLLKKFSSEALLKKREERGFLLFRANRESSVLKKLSHIYWEEKLKEMIEYLEEELHPNGIALFGSLANLEVNENSDIDIVVFTTFNKNVNLEKFRKKLGREVQIFKFASLEKVNKELRTGILRGHLVKGSY